MNMPQHWTIVDWVYWESSIRAVMESVITKHIIRLYWSCIWSRKWKVFRKCLTNLLAIKTWSHLLKYWMFYLICGMPDWMWCNQLPGTVNWLSFFFVFFFILNFSYFFFFFCLSWIYQVKTQAFDGVYLSWPFSNKMTNGQLEFFLVRLHKWSVDDRLTIVISSSSTESSNPYFVFDVSF